MDEPDLPPLPSSRSALPPLSRKRTHQDFEINNSSDPALFSSDDHLPAAEDYSSKRQKKKWEGTWWGDRLRSTTASRKRSFKRNYDSGIFMGSEGTDTSLDDEFLTDQHAPEDTAASTDALSPKFESNISATINKPFSRPVQICQVSPGVYHARQTIQRCLEEGSENVDLSSLFLETVPLEISTLKALTKHDRISDPPASQEGYASIEAKLRLYLANNSLKRVPLAVPELENLRLLSLRQNALTHIPAGIRRLVNLQILNVAGNSLTHLPFEIIELFHHHSLVELVADPNPWEELPEDEVDLTNQNGLTESLRYARVHIGNPIFRLANGTRNVACRMSASREVSKSKAPFLSELVLRRLQKLPELSSIDHAITESLPETAQRMLIEAQEAQSEGGRQCTKCHANIVIPRKQWKEWWSIAPGKGDSLPFLRQQCHERCAGDADSWTTKHGLGC